MRYSYCILLIFSYSTVLGASSIMAQQEYRSITAPAHYKSVAENLHSSVLAEGQWIRFSVSRNGIYKITAELLQKAGININDIDPRKIGLYGYGGGMLPQSNAVPRPIDLPELPIFIHGEQDGKFDLDDFIVFYAEGPNRVVYQEAEKSFRVEKNLYADSAFYFLSIQKTAGKRISEKANESTNYPKIKVFDDYFYHENELYNILSSGRKWYGERFSPGATENFSFTIPDFKSDSEIKVYLQVMSSSTAPSNFGIRLNNSALGELPVEAIPKVDFNTGQNIYAIKGKENQKWFRLNLNTLDNDNLTLNLTFNGETGEGYAYLNELIVHVKRNLIFHERPFLFRSIASLSQSFSTFEIKNESPNAVSVWDVTNPLAPQKQDFNESGESILFGTATNILRQYAVFDFDHLPSPSFSGSVKNQNIRGMLAPEMLIVSYPEFIPEAERLADFRESHDNLKVTIVTPSQIYNEFSSGRQDISAIRDYVKYLYDNGHLKYLLLFGKCSFAYKDIVIENTNFVPTYQSYNALSPVETYSSDDFFGFLEEDEGNWGEGINAEEHDLEIGIGRLPVKSAEEARIVVDKIINYSSNKATYGPWRNEIVFVADDGDTNTHQQDADQLATKIDTTFSSYHVNKIYLGAYPQEGNTSEATQNALNDAIKKGALIVNYSGHGNESIWAEEKILTFSMINQWENYNKLPLFVTATCEFGRYDNPYQVSGGEYLLLNPKGGAIGLVTTCRPVFSNTNFLLNNALYDIIFDKGESGNLRLGDIIKSTKNNSLSGWKNRNFTLLGDPSLKLAIPEKEIEISNIYTEIPKEQFDTLKALSKIHITGHIINNDGTKANTFNGIANVTVYDKPFIASTLSSNGPVMSFSKQNKVLFKGKVSIRSGEFEIKFIVPKNINYAFGSGKISFYGISNTTLEDAHAGVTDIVVGGSTSPSFVDNEPPEIALYMDDESFESGDLTGSNTLLLARLKDESGINIASNGLGQDLVATINGGKTYTLNDFFETDLDSYQNGWVSYPIHDLDEGNYTLKLKAWDINSNSAEKFIKFVVAADAKLALRNVLNFPNPFREETTFVINHNRAGEDLNIIVSIYSMQGELVSELRTVVKNSPSRFEGLVWDGTNGKGNKLSSGIYIYKVFVQSLNDFSKTKQYQRLVIIN